MNSSQREGLTEFLPLPDPHQFVSQFQLSLHFCWSANNLSNESLFCLSTCEMEIQLLNDGTEDNTIYKKRGL